MSEQTASIAGHLHQIWPFGHGCLITGRADAPEGGKLLIVRAVPDDFIGQDKPESEAWAASIELEGPAMALHFKDNEAIDRMIETLTKLKEPSA